MDEAAWAAAHIEELLAELEPDLAAIEDEEADVVAVVIEATRSDLSEMAFFHEVAKQHMIPEHLMLVWSKFDLMFHGLLHQAIEKGWLE